MIYKWKIPVFGVSAQDAGEELERIKTERGFLSPEAVVDESRPPEAPLHGCFEWDDAIAAEKYRCQQASHIIRSITVDIERPSNDTPVSVRAFVAIPGGYTDIITAIKTPDYHAEILREALDELSAFKKKYNDLCELSLVFEAIEKVSA